MGRPPPYAALTRGNSLIRYGLDGVRSYYLDRLRTLRRKILEGCRILVGLRLLQPIPLGDGHTLGSYPFECNDLPSSRSERATTGSLLRSLDKGAKRGLGRSIERFDLCDYVGFWLGLSVQPLHGRCAECSAGNHGNCDLRFRIHKA